MNSDSIKLDWDKYIQAAKDVVGEGCILLENKDSALPLRKGDRVSVFGRMLFHYYKSGTGSGGMVNVSKVYGLLDGLRGCSDIVLNERLLEVYDAWEETHLFEEGEGWGAEPWSQEEMPVTEELVREAASESDLALIVIARTAGEDKDFSDTKGAYRLSDTEEDLMEKVCRNFKRTIVLLNVGSIMDLDFMDKYKPSATMLIWQGGMIGGLATAEVLTGKYNPSGKLPDSVAVKMEDYPAYANFGDPVTTIYAEDIYVGYRYFETFARDKIRFPFGYGLSYTSFECRVNKAELDKENKRVLVEALVKNTGDLAGKEVVQAYVGCPMGKLGKPARVLAAFCKTGLLEAGETENIRLELSFDSFASFDDKNATKYPYSFVLEEGAYSVYVGTDSKNASKAFEFTLDESLQVQKSSDALGPVMAYKRMKPGKVRPDGSFEIEYEDTPVYTLNEDKKRLDNIPKEIPQDFSNTYSLNDVRTGRISMEQFVGSMTDEDLACIVRGEGMGSVLVTPGTAAAFAGVSKRLRKMDIPAVCCDDGPSGMRLDSGVKAFSLPGGIMLASTFNPQLVTGLYSFLALEMITQKVDVLLGPGINIHRHPLNGRNFEYFSEDPLLTGKMAAAVLKGLKAHGVSGTIKHFCGNNQEHERRRLNSVISERALREIYLKTFEIAVKSGYSDSVMTTYGQVNGRWTAGNYDLNTVILRDEWGFKGIVMTDWWAMVNERNGEPSLNNTAAMVRAQNDIYMVVDNSEANTAGDNTISQLEEGALSRSELQRCAANICGFAMNSFAMRRLMKENPEVEIVGRSGEEDDFDFENVEYISVNEKLTFPLNDRESKAGTNYYIPVMVNMGGAYEITITGSSDRGELAQIPCTIYFTGIPYATFTFNGTGGRAVSLSKKLRFYNKVGVLRLNVARNGVKLEKLEIKKIPDDEVEETIF